jgi:hypothetical protein
MPAEDVSLTAKFSANKYTVSFDGNGVANVPQAVTAEYLTAITLGKPQGSVDYKTFGGWKYNGKVYGEGEEFVIESDCTLVAVWNSYDIRVKLVDWDGYVIMDQTVKSGWALELSANSIYKSANEFGGFYTEDIFGAVTYYNLGTQLSEDLTAQAYYVNRSANPSTNGSILQFVDSDNLVFKLNADNKTYNVSGREWAYVTTGSNTNSPSAEINFKGASLPKDMYLPVTYNGKLVTAIADSGSMSTGAFSIYAASNYGYDGNLYKFSGTVYIPSAYTKIGAYAFYGQQATTLEIGSKSQLTTLNKCCNLLMKVTRVYGFPEGLQYVAQEAMETGQYTEGNPSSFIIYKDNGQALTTFPSSITFIGVSGFEGCDIFTEVDLSNVTTLGNRAFAYCNNITKLTLSNKVTKISENAFLSCQGLVEVNIPAQVKTIDTKAFGYCYNLTKLTFSENSNLTTIGTWAFYNTNIESLILPDSVTDIGNGAFSWSYQSAVPTWSVDSDYSTNLKTLKLSKNLVNIGHFAFYGAQITELELPDKLETIGVAAFMNTNITKIELPDSVRVIYDLAFAKLKKYTYTDSDKFVLHFGKNLVTLGGNGGVSNNGMHTGYVFRGFNNIVGIEFDEDCQLTTIASNVFCDMRGLTGEIIFPSKLQSLGGYQFIFCNDADYKANYSAAANIQSVFLPKSLTTIYGFAFSQCQKLSKVEFEDNFDDDASLTLTNAVFNYCTSLTEVELPCQVTYMPGGLTLAVSGKCGAFFNCSNLKKVVFRSRSSHTDADGNPLSDFDLSISSVTFSGCTSLQYIYTYRTKVIDVYFPRSSEETDGYLYYGETEESNCLLEDCGSVRLYRLASLANEYAKSLWQKKTNVKILDIKT